MIKKIKGKASFTFILALTLCIVIIVGSGITFTILNLQLQSKTTLTNPIRRAYVEWNLSTNLANHDQQDIQKVNQQNESGVRVLCWILTTPRNHLTKAIHVRNTWGKRCNKLLFISSAKDPKFEGTIVVLPNVKEGRQFLWKKTREAFKYVYKNHYQDADWFFKADDDTYTIVENLRYFLQDKNPEDPVYFGNRLKPFVTQGFMSGGAGYVLSKEALRRLVKLGLTNSTFCPPFGKLEDVEMGKCLQNLGVKAGDARDRFGRNRFLPMNPEIHLIPGHNASMWFWYARDGYYRPEQGPKCCSDEGISFHYVLPNQMYVMDYLIYQLKPHFPQSKSNLTENSIKTKA